MCVLLLAGVRWHTGHVSICQLALHGCCSNSTSLTATEALALLVRPPPLRLAHQLLPSDQNTHSCTFLQWNLTHGQPKVLQSASPSANLWARYRLLKRGGVGDSAASLCYCCVCMLIGILGPGRVPLWNVRTIQVGFDLHQAQMRCFSRAVTGHRREGEGVTQRPFGNPLRHLCAYLRLSLCWYPLSCEPCITICGH